MNTTTILAEFVSEELLSGRLQVGPDDSLLAEGMVDSLGMLRLVAFIEERFAFRVPPDQFTIENFRTVGVLGEWLARSMAAGKEGTGDD